MEVPSAGAAVAQARGANGWSQEHLARVAGVPQSHIAKIERGADVRISTLRRVMRALGYEVRFDRHTDALIANPPRGSRVAAARDFGVDLGQLHAAISRTPQERLDHAVDSANALAELFS